MHVKATNIRKISDADFKVDGIALVTAGNECGKTSLRKAIGAALTGTYKIYGAKKGEAPGVVMSGCKEAHCNIMGGPMDDTPEWSCGVSWPDGEIMGHGDAPDADGITIGTVNPVADYDKKQWAEFVRELAGGKSSITLESISGALQDKGVYHEARFEEVKSLLRSGWDSAADQAKKEAQKARREWEHATGDKFGSDKANGWIAEGYVDFQDLGDERGKLDALRSELAKANARKEVMGGQREDLVAEIQTLGDQMNALTGPIETLRTQEAETQKELSHYPQSDPLTCPCCQAKLDYKGGTLSEHKASDYERGSERHVELIDGLELLKRSLAANTAEKGTLGAKLQAAQSTLKKMDQSDGETRDPAVIEDEIKNLETAINAVEVTEKAGALFQQWQFWTAANEILGPTGLRLDATKEAVGNLQPEIDRLAKLIFPGRELKIDASSDGLEVRIDGRDYRTMVDDGDPCSYALALQVLFQVLVAKRMGPDTPILVDRADTMKHKRLNGVLNALVKSKVPTIMFKAVDERPTSDSLNKAGVGRTYFINDGVVEPVLLEEH